MDDLMIIMDYVKAYSIKIIFSILDYVQYMHSIKLLWLKRLKDHERLTEAVWMDKTKSKGTY